MRKIELQDIFLKKDFGLNEEVSLQGWIRNHRKQKQMGFIDFFDGTVFESIQVVYDEKTPSFSVISGYRVGSSIEVIGKLIQSEYNNSLEIVATEVKLIGDSPDNYPLQPKKHSLEFLREIAYLRPRSKLFQAVFRVRSVAAMAVHQYFQEKNYVYVNTPILTTNDGEGAGEAFTVTALDLNKEKTDFSQDFFGKQASLAVTGQLEGEAFAMAFKNIYTFGPTFRAENSNTKTHLAEFWMIEPEIAFCELPQLMDIQEDFLKYVVKSISEKCSSELKFLSQYNQTDLVDRHQKFVDASIARVTHEEAITILKEANVKFDFKPEYGDDLAKEHEKYLSEHFGSAVFVYNWPKDIKAFYMKVNEDKKTVAAVDLIVIGSGELMGGSQREARFDQLNDRMTEMGIPTEELYWYLNLRKFGTADHSGFGLGFERLVMFLTGMENIRDVIPFHRSPQNCEF